MIPSNACTLRLTAAAGTELAGASFGGTVTAQASLPCAHSFRPTGLYDPKAFITHAASLGQACAHCPIFPTAASRRSRGRVSVPVWLAILSDQLPVVALVGHDPTNELIGRGLLLEGTLPQEASFDPESSLPWPYPALAQLSLGYSHLKDRLPTCYAPVRRCTQGPKPSFSLDLHVLSTPPAFALSQDQTLELIKA
jgi:hypothetical protein